jgi:2-desacetyl-2-hydroxyethyl bacteriochlorophyllide A dehydrogenase
MHTLVCTSPGNFEYEEAPLPAIREGYTRLKITRVGICGTDLHAYEGTQPYFTYPRILGHELAAEVLDDGTEGFVKGEKVTFIPYFFCGHCIACRNGQPNCCSQIQVAGVHIDGGMREYISVPSYSLVHGAGLSDDELALVEPLAIGAHGIRRANIQPGEFVLIVGAGPIGIGAMEFARIAGAKVIAMDINDDRLIFCKEQLNIPFSINPLKVDPLEAIRNITDGDMPTVVIDATGNLKAINNSFQYLAHTGRYVLIGLQKGDISISHPEFHKREATLMSSRNATRVDFDWVIHCLQTGLIQPATYITHRVKFDEVKASFPSWLMPEQKVIKAMVML